MPGQGPRPVGENGAGKSTLMKILVGVEQPTHGRIVLDENEVRVHSPLDASRKGIGIIFQELNLCPNLSVTENIFLAREMMRGAPIDQKQQKEQVRKIIRRWSKHRPRLSDLRIGRQVVEIAGAAQMPASDHGWPTSALSTE
jgi:erythritol transport system ATP-binding protein